MSAVDIEGFNLAQSDQIVIVARSRARMRARREARLFRTKAFISALAAIVGLGVLFGVNL